MRLDAYLVANNRVTRSRAKLLIEEGAVSVNGIVTTKANKTILPTDVVTLVNVIPYVSRAGLKLEHALHEFAINPTNYSCLDIGSSTGGFTDCLLVNGAHVDAVDVGTNQLAESLRSDSRVRLYEQTDIRNFTADISYDLIVCDASFISLTKIIPVLSKFSNTGTKVVLLIKPQFEVGKEHLGKGGIVVNMDAVQNAITAIISLAEDYSYTLSAPVIPAGIRGGDGNQEYCAYFTYSEKSV